MEDTLTTEIIRREGAEVLVLEGAELVVRAGPDKGARLVLEPGPLRIGSAQDCDLVLQDRAVSAHHAEVVASASGYQLRDLKSTNGILLDQWRVGHVTLAPRLRLRLGATELEVLPTGETQAHLLRPSGSLGELVVHSVAMRAAASLLERYAASDMPLLIEGETGVGKEVAARAVHELSPRAAGPLVVVDLPAIPANLMAAELFGHERGAFTGAAEARPGLVEEARGGTLFLDEIGELPLELQPLLLRAAERKEARRVGGAREIAHDFRLISATNRNLVEQVRRGAFREDLFHRLAVGRVRVPPLRMRAEDVPHLAQRFAEEEGCVLSMELMRVLRGYDWPGNVRELRNTIARIAAMPPDRQQEALELDGPLRAGAGSDSGSFGAGVGQSAGGPILPLQEARKAAAQAFELSYLTHLLEATAGRLPEAAKIAQVSHSFISRLVRRYKDKLP